MTHARLTTEDYRRKVHALRTEQAIYVDARQVAIKRAVVMTLQHPTVARAVARGLRPYDPLKV